jgi:anaerobic magnesium-protoporphyrin IX monomethyl ester cyclase
MPGLPPKRRVLCVVPPTGKLVREDRCQTPIAKLKTIALRPPIDLMYAAGSYQAAGCEVQLRDYPAEDKTWVHFEQDLQSFKPAEVLLSITTVSLKRDLHACSFIKRISPPTRVVAKGAHFNTLDISSLEANPDLDIVLWGEYEHSCFELGQNLALESIKGISWRAPGQLSSGSDRGKPTRNPSRPFEMDLDLLPFPARALTNNALYRRPDTGQVQTTLVTNRGCPFHCVYCLANQVAGTKNRHRSIENILAEIKECISQHQIRNFLFRSELFTQNARWVRELCQAILDHKLDIAWACNSRVDTVTPELLSIMKKAGCWIMAFGVESGDQKTLDRLEKRAKVEDALTAIRMTRAAGIKSSVYLLIGLPWDTQQSILKQADFARQLDPDVLEVFYPYPFPGTALHQQAVAEGLLAEDSFSEQAYSDPVMPTKHLSIAELRGLRAEILRKFYLRPRVILRTLSGVKTFTEFRNYSQVAGAQLRAIWG